MKDLTQARKLIKDCQDAQNPYLNLGNCGITDLNELPELFECKHIETLSLSTDRYYKYGGIKESIFQRISNVISSIPEKISTFKKLSKLILRNNKISDIRSLKNLTGLQYLDLCNNEISDIRSLKNLTGLQYLDLGNNEISDIRFLEKLTGLQDLVINFNKISDIRSLEKLTGLQYLNIGYNQISDIRSLENLTGLKYLDISFNKISDIRSLENVTGLRALNLSFNQIKKIPLSIFQLNLDINMKNDRINGLCLAGNPITEPSLDIIKQGKQSILNWFESQKKGLNEIKIILIGEPKAGKTSLLKRLKNNTFDENEEQTDGVNIEDIAFEKCDTFKEQKSLHGITGHFWDFGGQEIMNATHQFFLTKRTIYVLVLDSRKDANNATQIRDWVKRVKATGGNSPIIILANQIDTNNGFGFENENDLKKEFPEIKYFEKISCKENINIDLLKNKLAELIPTAELFNTEIDERWIAIKNKLQEETEKYLTQRRFMEICDEAGLINEQDQKNAVTFLHDLGSTLHFEDLNLADYYVLNPYWITYGAYQILTSKYAGGKKGIVAKDELDFIINKEEDKKDAYKPASFEKIKYAPNEIRFLTDILQEFKLCFWTTDHNHFIISDLLDTSEPLPVTEPIKLSDESIQFSYQYDYLPKSVLPNIMVETHPIMTAKWRTGCVLQKDDCQAVISSYQHRISIIVTGDYKKKREFMAVIRHILNVINQKLTGKIKMQIPLPGMDNEYVDYEELLGREKDGERFFTIYKPSKKQFDISKLLEGIREEKDLNIHLLQKMDEKLSRVEINTNKTKENTDIIIDKLDRLYSDSQAILDNIISTVKASSEKLSNEQEEIVTELSEIKEKLYEHKSDEKKMQSIHNILCGVAGNFTTEIIRSVIKVIMFALLTIP